ncbi:hypothetical protein MGG_18130, partial [Pyricularia oryzae 70-15]
TLSRTQNFQYGRTDHAVNVCAGLPPVALTGAHTRKTLQPVALSTVTTRNAFPRNTHHCAGAAVSKGSRQQDVVGPLLETALGNGKQETWARPWFAPLVHPVDGGPWWNSVTEAPHASHSHWESAPGLEDGKNSIAFMSTLWRWASPGTNGGLSCGWTCTGCRRLFEAFYSH